LVRIAIRALVTAKYRNSWEACSIFSQQLDHTVVQDGVVDLLAFLGLPSAANSGITSAQQSP